ncbi:MAG: hypothetical protein NUW37_12795 [Planctomycetes bacterium]|nr:hypothetical protein [Planctomycetota bacterium]
MKRLFSFAIVVLAICVFQGCLFLRMEHGHPPDAAAAQRIQHGGGTSGDIMGAIGAPTRIEDQGDRTWLFYDYTVWQGWLGGFGIWLGRLDGATDTMVVMLQNGKVVNVFKGPQGQSNIAVDSEFWFWPF